MWIAPWALLLGLNVKTGGTEWLEQKIFACDSCQMLKRQTEIECELFTSENKKVTRGNIPILGKS